MIGCGVDIGRVHDKTVLVFAEQDAPESEIIVRLVKAYANMPFEEQRNAMRALFVQHKPDAVCIDSTGIGMDTAERLRMEMPVGITPFTFTEETKSDLMGVAYDCFTSGKVRVPGKYRAVLEEFSNIRKEITPAGRVVYRDEPHGDIAWATALALYAIKKYGGQGPIRPAAWAGLRQAWGVR